MAKTTLLQEIKAKHPEQNQPRNKSLLQEINEKYPERAQANEELSSANGLKQTVSNQASGINALLSVTGNAPKQTVQDARTQYYTSLLPTIKPKSTEEKAPLVGVSPEQQEALSRGKTTADVYRERQSGGLKELFSGMSGKEGTWSANLRNAQENALARIGDATAGALESFESGFVGAGEQAARLAERSGQETGQMALDEARRNGLAVGDAQAERSTVVSDAVANYGDELAQMAAQDTEAAKEGLGKIGGVGVDIYTNLIQMAADSMTGAGLASMGARTFGGSAQEARRAGATEDQQLLYGASKAAVETLTEKMYDGVAGLYGKGAADEVTEKLIAELTQSEGGRSALRTLFAAASEGGEEAVSSLLDPALRSIYQEGAVSDYTSSDYWKGVGYDALIGGLVGALTTGVNEIGRQAAEQTTQEAPAEQAAQEAQQNAATAEAPNAAETLAEQNESYNYNKMANEILRDPEQYAQYCRVYGEPQGSNTQKAAEIARTLYEEDYNTAAHERMTAALEQDAQERADAAEQRAEETRAKFDNAVNEYENRSAHQEVADMLVSPTSFSTVSEILRNSEYKQAFIDLTGVDLNGLSNGRARNVIMDWMKSGKTVDASVLERANAEARQNAAPTEDSTVPPEQQTVPPEQEVQNDLPPEQESAQQETQTPPVNDQDAQEGQVPPQSDPLSDGTVKKTQTNSTADLFTDEERTIEGMRPEDDVHLQHKDTLIDQQATQRVTEDYEGEKGDLFSGDVVWNDADTAVAGKILEAEVAKARESGDYAEVARLYEEWKKQGTEEGRALRQRQRLSNTRETIVAETADTLMNSPTRGLTEQEKTEKIRQVDGLLERQDAIPQGDTAAVIAMMQEVSRLRKTTNGLSEKVLAPFLEKAASFEGGFDFLNTLLRNQIRNVAGDYVDVGMRERLSSYRYASMLSKVSTITRNIFGNFIGVTQEATSQNIGAGVDALISAFTGQRTLSMDASHLSSAYRNGANEAGTKAFIECALDASYDAEKTATDKYSGGGGRTFKMTGNFIERFLSQWQKYENFALKVPDERTKGGVRSEQQRGIDSLINRGALVSGSLKDAANEAALVRTFQNESATTEAILGLRNAVDKAGNRLTGAEIDLGKHLVPFAQVASNLTEMGFNYSGMGGVVTGIRDGIIAPIKEAKATGKPISAETQRNMAMTAGRILNGRALTALAFYAALKGVIVSPDRDDKNRAALEKGEGLSGTQLNISALERMFDNGSTELQDGDTLLNIGFAESLTQIMTVGALLADAYKEDGNISVSDAASSDFKAQLTAISEMPVISNISDALDAFEYSDAEDPLGQAKDAALSLAGSTASGYIPNALAGVAQTMDNTVRNPYAADSALEEAGNVVKARIPGLRETLPASTDSWGRERTYGDNPILNALNANVLPGTITNYSTNAVDEEVKRIGETNKAALPEKNAPSSVTINGTDRKLNEKEKDKYKRAYGTAYNDAVSALLNSSFYKAASDTDKADILADAEKFAKDKGKSSVVPMQGDKLSTGMSAAKNRGTNVGSYLSTYSLYGSAQATAYLRVSGKASDAELSRYFKACAAQLDSTKITQKVANDALKNSGLDEETQSAIWDSYMGTYDWKHDLKYYRAHNK